MMGPQAEEVIRLIHEIGYHIPFHQLRSSGAPLRLQTLCRAIARRTGTTPERAYHLCRHYAMKRDQGGPSSIPPRA